MGDMKNKHIRQPFRRARRTTRNCMVVRDPEPKTVCGEPVTDRDLRYSDCVRAGKLTKRGFEFGSGDDCMECGRKIRSRHL